VSGDQAQPAVFPGYAMVEFACGHCGHEWIGVAAVGTIGVTCPACEIREERFVWRGEPVDMPHDGAWLTGELVSGDWRLGIGDRGAGPVECGTGERRHGLWARIRAALLCLLGEFE
jgi:hypothetical protein